MIAVAAQHVDLDSLCIGKYAVLKEIYDARCYGTINGFFLFLFREFIFFDAVHGGILAVRGSTYEDMLVTIASFAVAR